MAWNMSAAKRRALVKLQLRDKNGRWIEMGRGVKWYSSKRKKEIGGTVVGSQGEYALVRLNKENPTHEPALVKVPARHIEVVSNKATLSDSDAPSDAPKSNLDTPEFEAPEEVGRKQSNAFVKPSDSPEDYSISETPDGNTYISRKDGAQLYFPARSLDVGDELIAPDGADESKPFSMGKAWAKKGAERLNTAGPKTGKVVSIEGDRYAIVQLPEGHTVDDKKNPGEQTDKVTVGLSNSVIKLTPGLKEALGNKLEDNFADTSQDDGGEEEIDPNSPDAQSDHIGREVTDEQLAEEDDSEDLQDDAPSVEDEDAPIVEEEDPAAKAAAEADLARRVAEREAKLKELGDQYDENGLTDDENKMITAYERMANRAADKFDDDGAAKFFAKAEDIRETGKRRLGATKEEAADEVKAESAPQEPEKAPESAPEPEKAPEVTPTPEEAPEAAVEAEPAKTVSTVPASKLSKLPTNELIEQYELAISSYKGRLSNTAPRQKRIDAIVDMLFDRADKGDADAEAWFQKDEDARDAERQAAAQAEAAPEANVSLDELEQQAKADGDLVLYHGGLPEGTTLDGIDLNRSGTQQNKRGATYGGFYLTDESSKKWSEDYAEKRNGVMHGFAIDKNARIDDRGTQQIDRISAEARAIAAEKADIIKGKDLLGRTQYVILNKDVVKGVGETNLKESKASASGFKDGYDIKADSQLRDLRENIEDQDYTVTATSDALVDALPVGSTITTLDDERYDAQIPYVKIDDNTWARSKGLASRDWEFFSANDMVDTDIHTGIRLPTHEKNDFTEKEISAARKAAESKRREDEAFEANWKAHQEALKDKAPEADPEPATPKLVEPTDEPTPEEEGPLDARGRTQAEVARATSIRAEMAEAVRNKDGDAFDRLQAEQDAINKKASDRVTRNREAVEPVDTSAAADGSYTRGFQWQSKETLDKLPDGTVLMAPARSNDPGFKDSILSPVVVKKGGKWISQDRKEKGSAEIVDREITDPGQLKGYGVWSTPHFSGDFEPFDGNLNGITAGDKLLFDDGSQGVFSPRKNGNAAVVKDGRHSNLKNASDIVGVHRTSQSEDSVPTPAPEATAKPELPPLVEGEELELPIPGVKKQGKRTDKSAQHLKTLEALEEGDRVSYTNAHDETSTYQKHADGTWDLLDPEDEHEDLSPLEEAISASDLANRHKRGDLEVSTVADQEEALKEERYKNTDEQGRDYFDRHPDPKRNPKVAENRDLPKVPTRAEQDKVEANLADKPWSAEDIASNMRDWFDMAQAVKDGDNRAIETMANNKRSGDEETFIAVNDKGQPFDVTLTYNGLGDPVVRISNFENSNEDYGDFEIDTSVMPKQLSTLIREAINSDDVAAAIAERNGSNDVEETDFAPVLSRYTGYGKADLTKAVKGNPDSGLEINGNYADVTDLDKAQDFLRDLVAEINGKIGDPSTSKGAKISLNRSVRDINALLVNVNDAQFERDGKTRPNKSVRDVAPETPEVTEPEESSAPMPTYPDTVDPKQHAYEVVPRGTIITHSKSGNKRIVVGSSRATETAPREYVTTRNLRDGKPFGPVLDNRAADFDEREELQRLFDEPEASAPEADAPEPAANPADPELKAAEDRYNQFVDEAQNFPASDPRRAAWDSAMDSGHQATLEGIERFSKEWYDTVNSSYTSNLNDLEAEAAEKARATEEADAMAVPEAATDGPKSEISDWKNSLDEVLGAMSDPELKESGNRLTAGIQKLNGLDGNPTVVTDREAFDALPGKKLFRGVGSEADAEKFMSGPNWVGSGGSGSGIYTSTNKFRGETFKKADGGALLEMKLREDAKIVDGDTLEEERRRDLEQAIADDDTVGQFLADGDLGKYAAARGLDGYSLKPNNATAYEDGEEYIVLTNRAAVSVLGKPVESAEDVPETSEEPSEPEIYTEPGEGRIPDFKSAIQAMRDAGVESVHIPLSDATKQDWTPDELEARFDNDEKKGLWNPYFERMPEEYRRYRDSTAPANPIALPEVEEPAATPAQSEGSYDMSKATPEQQEKMAELDKRMADAVASEDIDAYTEASDEKFEVMQDVREGGNEPALNDLGLTPEEYQEYLDKTLDADLESRASDPEGAEAFSKEADAILQRGQDRLNGVESTPEGAEPVETPEDTVEEAAPVAESDWVNPLDALDIARREPMAIDGETYPPTQQQQDVIDAVLAGLDTKVQAMAGTGKTSTLVALSRRIKEHGKQAIYIAFNKTVQLEAEQRMEGLPVEAKTGHGVAYNWALKKAPYLITRLNGQDPSRPIKFNKKGEPTAWADKWSHTSAQSIASDLGIQNGDVKDEAGQNLKYQTTVLAVRKTVEKYALSDKDDITAEHVPEDFEIHEDSKEEVVRLAKEYWKDLESENGNFRVTHDVYRKFWALSRPDLTDGTGGNKKGANILYIDEAQDTPPVLAKVVADQKMQKVIVGDPNQAIYAFAENIDYLSEADGDVELPLNKSWRFGPQVADIGNRFLEFLGSEDRVVGGGGESKITYGMEDADAVLVRTNAGMLDAILDEVSRDRRVTAPDGTRADLDKLIRSVEALKDGEPLDYPHDDLIGFKNWGEVLSAHHNGDKSVGKIVKLFEVTDKYTLARAEPGDIERMTREKMEKAKKAVQHLVQYIPKFETLKIEEEKVGDGTRTWVSGVDVHPDPKKKWTADDKYWATKSFSTEMGKILAPHAFDKKLNWAEQNAAYQRAGGLETIGFEYDRRTKRMFTDDPEAAALLKSFSGEADVTISTAHKSKGLEWDRVRIGDDFFVPYEDKDGRMVYPEDPAEYKLGYVAVTRAAKELDPGVLSWIYEQTSENGGTPGKKKAPEAVEAPEATDESAPEVSAPEDTTPAPEQVADEAPIEATPDTEESFEAVSDSAYDDDGLTPTEAARVAELDQQMADIYSGKSDADLKPVEDEWNDILEHGERRKKGEDLPEYEKPADVEEAPEEVAPEPETAPEPVVEEAPAPAPEATPEPEPAVVTAPEYDAEGLTAEERRRADQLEQAIYDAYRARKPETAKHLDTELNEILARGAERLKPRQKPAPAPAPAPVAEADAEPEVDASGKRKRRPRRDFSNVPVNDTNGTEIKAGDTIGHKKLGPVVVTGFLPASGRVTFIDPSTNKEASVKGSTISIIPDNIADAPEAAAPTKGEPGDRFTDLTTGKKGFYGANGEPIIVGQRVTTSDGRSGVVKSVYTASSGVAWIPVEWDDTGKITRVYGNLLGLEGGSDGGNGGGGSPEPEAPEPTAPEAPEAPETPSVPETAPALSIKDSVENYSGTEGFASSYDSETFAGNPLSASGIRRFEERVEDWTELRRDNVTQYEKGADGSVLTHGVKTWNAKTGEYVGLVKNVEVYDDDISIRIVKPTAQYEAEKDKPGYDPDYHSRSAVYDPKELISKPPTLWDGSFVDFSTASSVSEINSTLFQHYPSVHFNISENLQLAQAKLLAKAISANFRKFPMLENSMNEVTTVKPDDGSIASLASFGPDVVVFSDQSLNINPYSSADFKQVVNEGRGGWFNDVPNGKQADYIVTHEMGHALDGLTGWIGSARVYELLREYLAEQGITGLSNADLAKYLVDNKMISEYSAEMWKQGVDPDEMVAEAFADVEINGVNAKPVNKMIHRELMSRLDAMQEGGRSETISAAPESDSSQSFALASAMQEAFTAGGFNFKGNLPGGNSGAVLMTGNLSDGTEVVMKTESNVENVDKEFLAGRALNALGIDNIGTVRIAEGTTMTNFIDGVTGMEWLNEYTGPMSEGTTAMVGLKNGREVGLFDFITSNQDRHLGNWLYSNGAVAPIDHGGTQYRAWNPAGDGRYLFAEGPFAKKSLGVTMDSDTYITSVDASVSWTREELAEVRRKIEALASDYAAHPEWHKFMLDRLDYLLEETPWL